MAHFDYHFDNRAGILIFDVNGTQSSHLTLMFAPGFSEEDDMIHLQLTNLRFIRRTFDQIYGRIHESFEYTFGPNNNNTLEVFLYRYPVVWIGFMFVHIPGVASIHKLHDDRVELNPPPNPQPQDNHGYAFFLEVNRVLQAEAKRQDAARKGRNLAAFRTTMGNQRPPNNTPANWYYGRSVNPVPENVAAPNGPGNLIASGITGLGGTQQQQALQLRELASRTPLAPGVGGGKRKRKQTRRKRT